MEILVFAIAALVLANKGGPTPPAPPAVVAPPRPPPVSEPEASAWDACLAGGALGGRIGGAVGAGVGCGAGIAYHYRDDIGDGAEWVGDKASSAWNTVKGWFD